VSRSKTLAFAVVIVMTSTIGGSRAISATPTPSAVEVFAPYVESDRATFLRVLDAFTAKTGIKVVYTPCCIGSLPQLQSRIAAGNPPDVAIVFRPGDLAKFAHAGDLVPLVSLGLTREHMRRNFGNGSLRLASVRGVLYAVPLKASSKSLIWYRPDVFRRDRLAVPRTWPQLLAVTRSFKRKGITPWSDGCGPGAEDAWTLTDWFENIYLRTAGPAQYERLFSGRLSFVDKSVREAAKLMLRIINDRFVVGGIRGALTTSWIDAISTVFGRNAKAQLYMEGGFVGQIALGQLNTSLRPGVTINSTPWPTIDPRYPNATVGGVDFAVAINNTSASRQLLLDLSSAAAGNVWAASGAVTGSWSVSPNRLVPRSSYANQLVGNEAHQVANAERIEFDGSDELPGTLADDWATALQNIIRAPATLDRTLARFQQAAHHAFHRATP
jgi:alpha-glucoside transport system substrate-binding protein